MLYTRKGDNGTTKTFGCDQRISKSSAIAEALGSLDEINSFLGLCKVKSAKENLSLPGGESASEMLHLVQQNLFIIQAEMAGSEMTTQEEKVKEAEAIIDAVEKELPPIKSFFISGGTELASLFDIARTISRRAERRVVAVAEEEQRPVGEFTRAYLNRLSSLLYAMARWSNFKGGIQEEGPNYK
ncbi:MAG TPA: cob(I)yrinic acid a,c-diamide adenosyltransferase [Candidatus Paceibacterota bacterium]|nr:cob(I)yrinic acid a,c-diamide adenosyltransferase [Candidatus Paceibacterota bacterium]